MLWKVWPPAALLRRIDLAEDAQGGPSSVALVDDAAHVSDEFQKLLIGELAGLVQLFFQALDTLGGFVIQVILNERPSIEVSASEP